MSANKQSPKARPPLIIIVDDQEWTARAFESVLVPHGYLVIRCKTARQTIERVQSVAPDAILIKSDLPDLSGAELCRALKEDVHISATTPLFIASSAPMRRVQRLEALTAGAWDLINLPIDTEEFLLRLSVYVGAKLEADRAREESLLDLGSGLYSVHGLLRRVRELSLDARRHGSPIACVVIAPEDAASPSEELSDRVSERLIQLITSVGRGSDAIGRLNQTEFVVVAPRTSTDGVMQMAKRFRDAADAFHSDASQPEVKIRVGCYAVDDLREAVIEPVEILVRATLALRRAQRDTGAPPICFFGHTHSAS